MSAEETRALIAGYYAAFNAADWEAMAGMLDEDVAHDINQGTREIGRERFRWFLGEMARHYRETVSDLEIMVDAGGNRAAAEFTLRGTYLNTVEGRPPAADQDYSLPAGAFFEVDDGRITRVTTYYNLNDWMARVER